MKTFLSVVLIAGLSSAQMEGMSVASAAPTGIATHSVTVGGVTPVSTGMAAVLKYTPESITANKGDVVTFFFMQKNHTVTQSTFAEPCKKMEGGMDSGFMPNPQGKSDVTWSMTVETTDPLWFFCQQETGIHCGKGMVFSINPATTGDKTMVDFKGLAIKSNGTSLKPGALQSIGPDAAAAPTTVTLAAGAAATTVAGAAASASVVAGQGQDGQGNACSCSCLCGTGNFPQNAAVANFGGFPGQLPVS